MLLLSVTKIFNMPPARGYQHISDGLNRLIRKFTGCVNGIRSVDRQDASLGASASCRPSQKDPVPQLREFPRSGDLHNLLYVPGRQGSETTTPLMYSLRILRKGW